MNIKKFRENLLNNISDEIINNSELDKNYRFAFINVSTGFKLSEMIAEINLEMNDINETISNRTFFVVKNPNNLIHC
jgi:hypothetical protein